MNVGDVAAFDQAQARAIELLRSAETFFFAAVGTVDPDGQKRLDVTAICGPVSDEWRQWTVWMYRDLAAHMLKQADAIEVDVGE